MSRPLNRPTHNPTAMPTAKALTSCPSPPSLIALPAAYAARPSVEPTDRSTLRISSTKVSPIATMPVIAAASIRSVRPCVDKKRWLAIEVPMSTNSSAAPTGTSRRRRKEWVIVCVTAARLTVGATTLMLRLPDRSRRA